MRRYRRRARSQYLLPFVILVSLGVVVILAFQLWGAFFAGAKGDAIYFLAEGRSKVLAFGTNEWENLYNGSKVKLGDSVKTQKNSKGVIQFYDGTVMRLDEDTQVTLLDISKKSDYQEILIFLNDGQIWVNKPKQNVIRKTDFVINTNYASYSITGTVFALEKGAEEILRVIRGQVQVDIIEQVDGKSRSIESVPVGIGQQITLSDAVMQEYYQRKSPSVLGVLDPLFQASEWYLWNVRQDENPTDFSKWSASGTIGEVEATPDMNMESGFGSVEDAEDSLTEKSDLAAPTLLSPKTAAMVTAKDVQTISGRASEGTKKVLLRQLLAGEEASKKILITSFDPVALTWSYDLSEAKANIRAGKNIYEFVGIDEGARETVALKVEIDYQKDQSEPDLVIDRPEITQPKITSVGDKPYKEGMTLTTDGFAIVGGISGADAVWVDDFKLNRYAPGDASWTYNVRTTYGNLKPGLNSYQVYGVTESGKKSPVTTVKFYFEPPQAAASADTQTAESADGAGEAAEVSSSTTSSSSGSSQTIITGPERPLNALSD